MWFRWLSDFCKDFCLPVAYGLSQMLPGAKLGKFRSILPAFAVLADEESDHIADCQVLSVGGLQNLQI